MEYRHTADHDAWSPDGACDAPVIEPDGSVTRCGYRREVRELDLTSDLAQLAEPVARNSALQVFVAVVMAVLGILIALDWLAFVLVVARGDSDPRLAIAFAFRIGASVLYGMAAVWLWRRR
jgi:hypothetical protein